MASQWSSWINKHNIQSWPFLLPTSLGSHNIPNGTNINQLKLEKLHQTPDARGYSPGLIQEIEWQQANEFFTNPSVIVLSLVSPLFGPLLISHNTKTGTLNHYSHRGEPTQSLLLNRFSCAIIWDLTFLCFQPWTMTVILGQPLHLNERKEHSSPIQWKLSSPFS